MKTGAELWPEAKRLMLPYEGMASQIYVLDLPIDSLDRALDILSNSITHPRVGALDHEDRDRIPFTSPDYSRSPPDLIEASGIGRVDGGIRGGL